MRRPASSVGPLPGGRRAACLAAALAIGLAAAPAVAEPDVEEIEKRLNKIEARLSAARNAGADDPTSPSALLIRLNRLEESLRQMTGQIEQSQFLARQAGQKVETLSGDLIGRLIALEEKILAREAAAQSNPDADAETRQTAPALPEGEKTAAALSENPDSLYSHAVNLLLAKKDYEKARIAFDLFLGQYPDHPKAGHSLYWLGEANYIEGNYKAASEFYLESYASYGGSPKAADSLLKLAMSLSALGQSAQACSTFSELNTRFPDAPQRIARRVQVERQRAGCG